MDFAISSDHSAKIKESEKRNKYLDLVEELRKIWEMIPSVTGELGTITKGLVRGLEVLEIRVLDKTIQTTELLRSARIQRKIRDT